MKNAILLGHLLLIAILSFGQEKQLFSDNSLLSGIIPNEGQLNGKPHESALYFAQLGNSTVYFYRDKLVFSRYEYHKLGETDTEEDAFPSVRLHNDERITREEFHTELQVENVDQQCELIPENRQLFTSIFTVKQEEGLQTIRTKGYSKLVYKNVYPRIDWVIEMDAENGRMKYAFVLQKGSEPAQIRLHYANAEVQLSNGNEVQIETPFGRMTDRLGDVWYEKNHVQEKCRFVDLGNATIGFKLPFTKTKEKVIIDPWLSSNFFVPVYRVFDVDYDSDGNVYAYLKTSSLSTTTLLKLNSAGTLLWSYNPLNFAVYNYYGDFAIDRSSNQIYLVEGFNPDSGAQVYKLNANGNLMNTFDGEPLFAEMWRISFSTCSNQAVIAGGGTSSPTYQTCFLDTSLTNLTMVQYVPTTNCCHDVGMLTLDEFGNCYQVTTHSSSFDGLFDSHLVKLPLPTLLPVIYNVPTGYQFDEAASNTLYDYDIDDFSCENGFNGITTANGVVYTSDGRKLKKWDGANGALLEELTINNSPGLLNNWSGIASDGCGNVFVGVEDKVLQFDGDLNQITTYSFPDTITDIVLMVNGELLVSGYRFVSRMTPTSMTACDYSFIDIEATLQPSDCEQGGAISVQINGGEPPYTVVWNTNPPTYGTTLTNVPPGEYVVSVNDSHCANFIVNDTVIVSGNSSVDSLFANAEPVNIFTPNNDTENPVFYPLTNYLAAVSNANFTGFSLVITNRWGNVVFETTDKQQGWNGTTQSGKAADEGVYYWLLNLETTCDKEVVRKQGFVHLQK